MLDVVVGVVVEHGNGGRVTTGRYVLVLVQRVVLLAVAVVLGAGLSVFLGRDDAPEYTSSVTFTVGPVAVDAESSISVAGQTARLTLPSLLRVAESGEVLARAEDQLDLPSGTLAGAVTASRPDRALSYLTVRVTGPDPRSARARAEAVSDAFQQSASELTSGAVAVDVVAPPRTPGFPSSAGTRFRAVVGGGMAAAVAVLAIGLVESAGPRFRSRRDGDLTGSRVLVHPRRTVRRSVSDVDRLAQRLTWMIPAEDAHRVAEAVGAPARRPPAVTALPTADGDVLVVQSGRARTAEVTGHGRRVAAVVLVARPVARWADAAAERVRHLLGDRRSDRRRAFAAAVPAAALLVISIDPRLPGNLNAAALISIALAPVWLPHLPGFRGARTLMWLGALALGSGTVLAITGGADHEWSRAAATGQALSVVGMLGVVGLVCWARTVMPSWAVPVVLGVGLLVGAIPAIPTTVNPVKFIVVFPLALILLALCDAWGRAGAVVGVCAALAVLVVANDGRSAMAFLVSTAAVVLWQVTRTGRRSLNRSGTVLAVVGSGVAGYLLISDLLVSGFLGDTVAERSRTQVEQSGSLLLGGRPEWSGTLQLMSAKPTGFGLGTVPNSADVTAIKQGFEALRIPTADGYIQNYLTAGRFELHSVVADLWVWLGVPGLVLGLVAAGLVLWGLVDRVASARCSAALVFLGLNSLWFLAFGPLPSNGIEVAVCIGLCLLRTRPVAPVSQVRSATVGGLARPDLAVQPVVSR